MEREGGRGGASKAAQERGPEPGRPMARSQAYPVMSSMGEEQIIEDDVVTQFLQMCACFAGPLCGPHFNAFSFCRLLRHLVYQLRARAAHMRAPSYCPTCTQSC
jgi:hypothetical protein